MPRPAPARGPDRSTGFTLVELILVMGLLAAVMGLAAPTLSRYFRGRHLAGEAARLLALTEYARSEAVSRGMPASVWIRRESGEFGVQTRLPWEDASGGSRAYRLHRDVSFRADGLTGAAGEDQEVIVFAPDGFLEADSVEWIGLEDREGETMFIQQNTNQWAYEVARELRDDRDE